MKKKIFLIIMESRVRMSDEIWNTPIALYAVKTFKQALIDCKKHNDAEKSSKDKDNYLQYRYRIEIISLYE